MGWRRHADSGSAGLVVSGCAAHAEQAGSDRRVDLRNGECRRCRNHHDAGSARRRRCNLWTRHFSPAAAAVAGISPAGILNGAIAVTPATAGAGAMIAESVRPRRRRRRGLRQQPDHFDRCRRSRSRRSLTCVNPPPTFVSTALASGTLVGIVPASIASANSAPEISISRETTRAHGNTGSRACRVAEHRRRAARSAFPDRQRRAEIHARNDMGKAWCGRRCNIGDSLRHRARATDAVTSHQSANARALREFVQHQLEPSMT